MSRSRRGSLSSTVAHLLQRRYLHLYSCRSRQAAVDERLPRLLRLVYCSSSVVGGQAPQFESFYTVPVLTWGIECATFRPRLENTFCN